MSPVVCVRAGDGHELIDGFKRLRVCRKLGREALRAKTVQMSARACKAAIIQLNAGKSITEMEEALVIRSLHREDGLMLTEIAVLLGRHKSWASRRLSLIERLSEDIQEDIRLGLFSASVGRELAKLPRGNQRDIANAVIKHRLSIRELEKLVSHLLSRPVWEYQAILYRPWEIIEREKPKPVGLEAKLISFAHICRAVSERVRKSKIETYLYEPLERAISAAQETIITLKAVR
ncbi:MAG TPA: hypothetical protein DCP92_21780 [Nitrospiraceae bacterium]|jgi:ParB-like chromosome segregation protein Spo0J|nr:hypothetical protein [Nitrospiraceae bacterium]